MRKAFFPALALLLAGLAAPAHADTVSAGRLTDIPLVTPDGDPGSLVVYLSDRSGWTARDDAVVEAMRQAGSVVLKVDFAKYAKALDADDGECLYVVAEITDIAQTAQRKLGIASYLPPIVAGSGEGATFAYAAVADSPANTLGGAVAIGFDNRLGLREPFCPGAKSARTASGAWSYGFDVPLPQSVYLLVDPKAMDATGAQTGNVDGITLQALKAGDEPAQAADAVQALMDELTPPDDLPLVDLPSTTGQTKALAVFVSGDGGWRDIDKTLGEWMTGQGIHVLGLDSLHYFWSERRPEEFAADIAAIVKQADPTGKQPVMLLGYSFGADTLPFAWPYLGQELKGRVRMIGLLSPSETTDFQVSVEGWLGVGDGAYKVPQAIAALPARSVVCVWGEEEDDASCPDSALDAVTRIKLSGGHHFDGDYEALGGRLLQEFAARQKV